MSGSIDLTPPVLPDFNRVLGPPKHVSNPASWTYERIARQIAAFEEDLDKDEEVGLRLVSTPGTAVMHVQDVGYWGPDLIIYYGTNEHGKPMELMQHHTQTSILLTAVPKKDEKPNRIGFHLIGKIDDSDES